MTAKEARLELEQVNTWLRQAVENALEMKAAASEIPASLERVADCLSTVAESTIEDDPQLLLPQLQVMRSRMRQLQTLLDSAAAFYCASIARSRSGPSGSYTASGNPMPQSNLHQLHLEA